MLLRPALTVNKLVYVNRVLAECRYISNPHVVSTACIGDVYLAFVSLSSRLARACYYFAASAYYAALLTYWPIISQIIHISTVLGTEAVVSLTTESAYYHWTTLSNSLLTTLSLFHFGAQFYSDSLNSFFLNYRLALLILDMSTGYFIF